MQGMQYLFQFAEWKISPVVQLKFGWDPLGSGFI